MKEDFLVSVIIPIYNVEGYLNRCVESVVNQDYSNIEIILVDDGSLDYCPQICDEWREKDNRIIVIHKKNGGLSDARNVGMQRATGSYITFVDSDDWIEVNWISHLMKNILENQCEVSVGATYLVNDKKNVLFRRGEKFRIYTNREAVIALIDEKNIFPTVWDKIYKKELIQDIYFEKGKINEDEFWSWKVLMKASKIVVTNTTHYNYFQNEKSIMGCTYSIKRLDGLEARKQRFIELKEYKELWEKCNLKLVEDCMYHLQCTLRFLTGIDRENSIKYIRDTIKEINIFHLKNYTWKQFIWACLIKINPVVTCKIRNKLRIGL